MNTCRDYAISVSYGNYNNNMGGTDKIILSHQKMLNSEGISLIHIYGLPMQFSRFPFRRNDLWNVLEDGDYKGVYSTKQLMKMLYFRQSKDSYFRGMYIHHLRDVNLEELIKIIEYFNTKVYFYIHDYMTICPVTGLINSSNNYCGKDFPNIKKCANCCFYSESIKRLKEIKKFLTKMSSFMKFVAPSVVVENIWSAAYPQFKNKLYVIPHQEMEGMYCGNKEKIYAEDKLRIAFVGAKNEKKGWGQWKSVVNQLVTEDSSIQFFYFGNSKEVEDYIETVQTDFRKDSNAMVKNLRKNKIHAVVLWSVLPETYSFTFFEAYASNCFVLTNTKSGNIAFQTEKLKNGIIFKDECELLDFLRDENKIKEILNNYRMDNVWGPNNLLDNNQVFNSLKEKKTNLKCPPKSTMKEYIQVLSYRLIVKVKKYFAILNS